MKIIHTNPISSTNPKHKKKKKSRNYSKAYHNYLKPSENLIGSQRKRYYVQLNKDKNNDRFLITQNIGQEIMKQQL